jgi:hypothetical protein
MITNIQWNDAMKRCAKDKAVVVRTINEFTSNQLENPEWIIQQFIRWADPTSTLTIADFQSEAFDTQKGNLGEELTSIAFHAVAGLSSRQGETVTYDKVDLWIVSSGEEEVSISCKTITTCNRNVKEWGFPLTEKLNGEKSIPVKFERSCKVWTATVHYDLIEPNFASLEVLKGTRWIVFLFTKDQLKDRLGYKTFFYLKPGEHLEKAIYFNAEKRILNLEVIDRLIAPLFRK